MRSVLRDVYDSQVDEMLCVILVQTDTGMFATACGGARISLFDSIIQLQIQ